MSSTSMAVLFASMVGQWFTAFGSIWLTWWASQSRDAVALRVIAMVLVIVPALLWPFLTVTMTLGGGAMTGRAFLFGAVGLGVALIRALFLVIWAIVSRDRPYLRACGGVVAFLLVTGFAVQALNSLMGL